MNLGGLGTGKGDAPKEFAFDALLRSDDIKKEKAAIQLQSLS